MTTPPRTVWERSDELRSGMRVAVRGTAMQAGGTDKAAVTLSLLVPSGFHEAVEQGGRVVTALLNPDEARALAAWLTDAADGADLVGPPLYG